MERKKEELEGGYILKLADISYRMEKVIGRGGNAIVYRATYRDSLQKEQEHVVLIKELFPYTEDGSIQRGEQGQILCKEEKKSWWEMHKESFLKGNEIHLSYLREHPQAAGGNFNSYPANGTLYTIYPFDGGVSLEEYVKEQPLSLREMTQILEDLTKVLAVFHEFGMLHLDISPDNVLVLPSPGGWDAGKKRILFVDYNCAWEQNRGASGAYIGKKEGYSAPETMLGRTDAFGRATDLYSVCAVFFFLLTGRALDKEETKDRRTLERSLENCRFLEGEATTVRWKVQRILSRGLSPSPLVRYQSAEELEIEFQELKERILGRGISAQALWEISRREQEKLQKQRKKQNFACEMYLLDKTGRARSESILWGEVMQERKHILLLGEGGSGKTTCLQRLWKKYTGKYMSCAPVVYYLALPQCLGGKEKQMLKSYILGQFLTGEESAKETEKKWEEFLDSSARVLLLLDGLNETGDRKPDLLEEIRNLARKKSVQIVLGERKDTLPRFGFSEFERYEVSGLTKQEQEDICRQKGVQIPDGSNTLFRNRMFFSMYLELQGDKKLSGQEGEQALFDAYYEKIMDKARQIEEIENRGDPGACYAVEHLFSMIALEMEKRGKTMLTYSQMTALVEKNYARLQEKSFLLAFPQYLGKGSRIRTRFGSSQQWYDFAVNRVLAEDLKLLIEGKNGWSIGHQRLGDYFAGKGRNREKEYRRGKRKSSARKAMIAAVLITVAGIGIFLYVAERSYPFFPKDKRMVEDSVKNLGIVLSDTYLIAKLETDMLRRAEEYLQGTQSEAAYERWADNADDILEQCAFYANLYRETAVRQYLPLAEQIELNIVQEAVHTLFSTPSEKFSSMETRVEILKERVGQGGADAQKSIAFYKDYVDAYVDWLNWQTAIVLDAYPEKERSEFNEMLRGQVLYSSIRESREKMEAELENATKKLEEAKRQLLLVGM